ncbi:DoxX family protein [Aquimarina rhabdastrellae]
MKVVYWIFTALLCGLMLFSAQMYFRNTAMVEGFFESFNYPKYIVIPLAIAKVLAVIAILTNKIKWIKEWAYAGLFFDLVLATAAHQYAGHPIGLSFYGIIFLIISYAAGKKVRP